MKIILDPSRDGCTVWIVDFDSVRYLRGSVDEICKRIYDFATFDYYDYKGAKPERVQAVEITLDRCNYGNVYLDILENRYKLKVTRIKTDFAGI